MGRMEECHQEYKLQTFIIQQTPNNEGGKNKRKEIESLVKGTTHDRKLSDTETYDEM